MKTKRLQLKFFLPMLADAVGKRELQLDFPGETVRDLLSQLVRRYGRRAAEALYDSEGKLDLEVQVLINESKWVNRESLDTSIRDGDQVTIMILMAGG
jgi:MoaD family protein